MRRDIGDMGFELLRATFPTFEYTGKMRAPETTRFMALSFAVSFAAVVGLNGCGTNEATASDDDLSTDVDLLDGGGVLVAAHWPDSARRGPVLLTVDLVDPENRVSGVRVEREAGNGWVPISARWNEQQGKRLRWAWDSFADVSNDGPVKLRFIAAREDGDVTLERTVELRNAPDTDRLVLVSHAATEDEDGGYDPQGNELSALVWNGQEPGVLDEPIQRVTVGYKPGLIRAAPHGRAAAVDITAFGEWAIDIVKTPLDAIAAEVEVTHSLTLPEGTPMDFRWSPDGRYLWVLGNGPNTLWRYEPSENLSSWPAPTRVAELPGPAIRFAIDPTRSRLFVYCGFGGVEGALDKLVLYDSRGTELGRFEDDLGGTSGVAVSADGTLGLWTSGLMSKAGDDVRLFSLENGVSPVGVPVELESPFEAQFHPSPDSHAVLVSRLEKNAVTPLSASATSLAAGTPITGLPLAAEMDRIERGPQTGTFLVPVVSSPATIKSVLLKVDGTAEKLDVSVELGSGFGATPSGISIQR